MTSTVSLFFRMGFPDPWATVSQARKDVLAGDVVVYGAFVVKLLVCAKLQNCYYDRWRNCLQRAAYSPACEKNVSVCYM